MADRSTITAITVPMTMSGHGEDSAATGPSEASTPMLEMTPLREHSKVLAMLRSSFRNLRSSDRQRRFAASAAPPKASISVDEGGTPLPILTATLTIMLIPRSRIAR